MWNPLVSFLSLFIPPAPAGYSARFAAFMPLYLDFEGGLCSDPGDTGGLTNFGIDQASHPKVDVRNLTKEDAMEIYWADWQRLGIERMSSPLGEVYFDTAENLGVGEANMIKARKSTWSGFIEDRRNVYDEIAERHPADHQFLAGWLNRCTRLAAWCRTV